MRRRRGSNTDQRPLLSGVNISDVNIMLLGSTGAGKSASGNTIIGAGDTFREDYSPEAVTTVCYSAQTEVHGQTITVIDTVGLSDTAAVKITDAQTEIEKMIQTTNLDVFLLVIRLGEAFTKEKAEVVNWIKDNFGEKVINYTIVLFTHGDELGVPIEKYLAECKALQSVVGQFSGGFHIFNNTIINKAQVTELLDKINRLRSENNNSRYTEQDYAKAQNLNIMLLGSTQGGKSASGNTIIGAKDTFRADFSSEAVTRFCYSAQTEVDGQTITVIDTVGLCDTAAVKITDAQTEIEKMIQENNLVVFLLVIRLGEAFTKEKADVVNWIKENFGGKVVNYTIVLFTRGDEIPEHIEYHLSKCEALRSVVDQFSGRFHVFNNKVKDQAQVTELLEKINRLRMVNGNCRYTEQDYAKAQKDILQRKCLIGAAKGAGVGAGAGAAVGGGAAAGGAIALKVGAGVVLGAAGGAVVLGAAVGAGVYFLARKYRSRQQ